MKSSVQKAHLPWWRYVQYVEDQARNAGIVVPLLLNDEWAAGNFLPGSGEGAVDIYVSHSRRHIVKQRY